MIEISLIALKFAALIVGGVFAAIGLLTDYRHEDGTVSKWGKIALFGIILSTIIAAGTQAVESYRDRQTALANDAANRSVLQEIRRAVFPLRSVAIMEIQMVYPADVPLIASALNDLTGPSPSVSGDESSMRSFRFDRRSSTYPTMGILSDLLDPHISVSIWKKGADPSKDDPDLRFSVHLHDTDTYLHGQSLEVSVNYTPIPDDRLLLSQGMASLEDIREGQVLMRIETRRGRGRGLTQALVKTIQRTEIKTFALSISNHVVLIGLRPSQHFLVFEGKVLTEQ